MPAAALAVHQLRYHLAYGSHARRELEAQGHAYLHSLAPWIVMLAALTFGAFVIRVAHAWRTRSGSAIGPRRTIRLWALTSLGLVTIYACQELLEGFAASGHPVGISGVFGGGGVWAIAAAIAVGGVMTLLVRGASAAIELVAAARPDWRRPRALRTSAKRLPDAALRLVDPLAASAAGRAPPPGVAPT
jgi:hypothetical protein